MARLSLVIATMLLLVGGCDRRRSTPPPAPTAVDTAVPATGPAADGRRRFGRLDFVPPRGWTVEEVSGGVLLMAPAVADEWQANLFVEFGHDRVAGRSLDQGITDLIPNLQQHKPGFRLLDRTATTTNPNGCRYARMTYNCTAGPTPLTEWEVVVRLGEADDRCLIVASSATASWGTNERLFSAFVDSLRGVRP